MQIDTTAEEGSIAPDSTWLELPSFLECKDSPIYRRGSFIALHPITKAWYYFKIKLGESRGLFVDIAAGPKILADGFVCYNNQIYRINTSQLLKGKLYVSPTNIANFGGTDSATSASAGPTCSSMENSGEPQEQSSTSSDDWMGDTEAADAAFQEQVRALHDFFD